jgi:hypothetical protein
MTKELSPRELADRLDDYAKAHGTLKSISYVTDNGNLVNAFDFHTMSLPSMKTVPTYCCLGVYAHECELGEELDDYIDVRDEFDAAQTNMIPAIRRPGWMNWLPSQVFGKDTMINVTEITQQLSLAANRTIADYLASVNDNTEGWSLVQELLLKIEKYMETGEPQ